jgi:phage-related protein
VSAGYVNSGDVNCTSKDIDIAIAKVSEYSFTSATGPFTTLAPNATIACTPGQTIYVRTSAVLLNNAHERYDVGLWINPAAGQSALTGTNCTHFNLLTSDTSLGVSDLDSDQCGDISSEQDTVVVPLDVLTLTCADPDNNGFVEVGACAAWQNSIGETDITKATSRVCPVTSPPRGGTTSTADGFRWGTTPETPAKCKCNPLQLPIEIQSILRIQKVTVPASDATPFTFTPTGWNSNTTFTRAGNQGSFASGPLPNGTYSVAETVVSGWSLTGRSCVITGTATPKTFTSVTNGVSVDLSQGEDVTCTFTNTKQPVLRIDKVTVPSGDTQSFTFTPSYNSGTTFNLTDAATPNSSGPIAVGTHTVAETVPSGWTLTSRACVLTGTATAKTFSNITNGVSVDLAAGEDVTCTFTNTKQAILRIDKVTSPSGDTQSFTFTPTGYNSGATFPLTDASTPFSSGFLAPGTYAAAETVPSGWALTSRACVLTGTATAKTFTQPTNGVSVTLAAGEDVTCTFTNTKQAILRIDKVTLPAGDPTSFTFTPTYNSGTTFGLTDASTPNSSGFLAPGSQTVTETVPSGWALTGRACVLTGTATAKTFTSPTNGVTLTLAAGEDVTCTFTNTKATQLRIDKVTVPSGDTQSFTFTPTGWNSGATFPLTDAATPFASGNLTPGTYAAAETVPSGWALTGRACVLTGTATAKTFTSVTNGVSVDLQPGEDVTCTFTNTKQAIIRTDKVTLPSGDTQSFTFTPTGYNSGATFPLTDAATPFSSGFVAPGSAYSTAETVPTGWDLTNRTCVLTGTATAKTFTSITNGVTVTPNAGEDITCTFTNTKRAQIRIDKVTLPAGSSTLFTFTPSYNGGTTFDLADATTPNASGLIVPGSVTVTETVTSGWVLNNRACVLTGTATAKTFTSPSNGVTLTLNPGEDVTCTFTNARTVVLVDKVLTGGGTQSFDFSESGQTNFPLTDAAVAHKAVNPSLGAGHQVCELLLAVAWNATFTVNGAPVVPTVDGTTGTSCITFTVAAGDSINVVVTNTPPPGGGTRTIGYWKNHASCATSNGGQYQRSIDRGEPEANLDFYLGGAGVVSIYPIGDITTLSCTEAVNLLSKNAKDGGKRAGDPIYNMVAQLLGAKLNVAAGAGSCPVLATALADAQTFLDNLNFDGLGSYKGVLSASDQTSVNNWAAIFGSYNEGTLGAPCPTHI